MEIIKINQNIRCDMGMCNNKAIYSIGYKDTLLKRKLNLCEKCAREIYKELGSLFIPKSPKNMISTKKNRRR